MFAADAERARQPPGAVHAQIETAERLGGAQQHRLRLVDASGDDIQHVMHAVDQVDVGMTGRTEHDRRPRRPAAGGMTGEVVAAHVGLGLDEPGTQDAPADPPAEHLPEERHGHGFGIAGIERALEDGARFGRRPAPCRHG